MSVEIENIKKELGRLKIHEYRRLTAGHHLIVSFSWIVYTIYALHLVILFYETPMLFFICLVIFVIGSVALRKQLLSMEKEKEYQLNDTKEDLIRLHMMY